MSKINKAYIAESLTLSNPGHKTAIEGVASICKSLGIEAYVPHQNGTDPIDDPKVSAQEVWETDYKEVKNSDLLIAYVGEPSHGVGAELEIARITESDIILWWYKGEKVSRMARGNPAIKYTMEIGDQNDLYAKLTKILKKHYV